MTPLRAVPGGTTVREELMHQAWLLREALDARGMVDLLSGVPRDVLTGEPELAHLLSWGLTGTGDCRGSLDLQLEMEPRVRARGNTRLLRWWLLVAGSNRLNLGDSGAARACWAECLDLASRVDDQYSLGWAANNLGGAELHLGRLEEAFASFQRLIASSQRRGYLYGLALGHHNLAALDVEREQHEQALGNAECAIAYARRMGSVSLVRWHDVVRSIAYIGLGDLRMAEALLRRALDHFTRHGGRFEQVNVLTQLGACARHAGRHGEARKRFAGALRLARRTGLRLLEAELWIEVLLLKDALGDPRGAARAAGRALRILARFGSTYYLDKHLPGLSSATRELIGEPGI